MEYQVTTFQEIKKDHFEEVGTAFLHNMNALELWVFHYHSTTKQ